ncbi:hypothetical protein B5M42_001255 [Paenibacillus athensensis]|uniref:Uncharacterized protein n=1 Tax=Paenibacillus athensensis TaxID=1967502 RepID=A0A4Y8Q746_9BACL|nr:hypothetical protein [Paenibacillus athensensis]MCD1257464.1 hypothetical protein [Paenibacillus athensensis]
MNFTSQDISIIERALQAAIGSEKESSRVRDYREVLGKLKENADLALDVPASVVSGELDGIRYDYDDSSDLL